MRARKPSGGLVAIGVLVLASGGGCGGSQAAPTDGGDADAIGHDGGADGGGADGGGADGGGADGGGDSDIIVIPGGAWPDSATGTCAAHAGPIVCPGSGAPFHGQDGTYRVAVPSYTVTTETVVDTVTSLMWERVPDATERTQADAAARCDALSLAGHEDWRLPTRLELVSVLDHGRITGGALPDVFGASSGGARWTSSPSARLTGYHFVVNLNFGACSAALGTLSLQSRCVRGDALTGSTQVGPDTVVDTLTGLEWQRSSLVDDEVGWEAALAYCQGLVLAGHGDWRLPSSKELATIVDETKDTSPVIDQTIFGASAATAYWSSSPSFLFPGNAYVLQTDTGISPNRDMTLGASARCVRQADR